MLSHMKWYEPENEGYKFYTLPPLPPFSPPTHLLSFSLFTGTIDPNASCEVVGNATAETGLSNFAEAIHTNFGRVDPTQLNSPYTHLVRHM